MKHTHEIFDRQHPGPYWIDNIQALGASVPFGWQDPVQREKPCLDEHESMDAAESITRKHCTPRKPFSQPLAIDRFYTWLRKI